jgi:hypothetical protein
VARKPSDAPKQAPATPDKPKIKSVQFMLNEEDFAVLDMMCRHANVTRSSFCNALVESQLHAIREIVLTKKPKLLEAVIQGTAAYNRFSEMLNVAAEATKEDMADMAVLQGI